MGRFRRVCEILDEAVGGPDAPVGFHGAVWRGITRDKFVTVKVFGKALVVVGDGATSNLVLALKGQSPFGADLPEPPADASLNRMPSGREPAPAESIAFMSSGSTTGAPTTWRRRRS